jgi:hypothetical protein
VTNGRLAWATVQLRLFRKARPGYALGASLELLSPSSVLRVLFGLVLLWPVFGLVGNTPVRDPTLRGYCALVLVATWAGLTPRGGVISAGLLALCLTLVTVAVATTVPSCADRPAARKWLTPIRVSPMASEYSPNRGIHEGHVIVAVVHLAGLAEARGALGHPAGTELLCRAVENVGRVIPDGIVARGGR